MTGKLETKKDNPPIDPDIFNSDANFALKTPFATKKISKTAQETNNDDLFAGGGNLTYSKLSIDVRSKPKRTLAGLSNQN